MITIPESITVQQAFVAMYFFLEGYYERTHSEEVGGLLGGLQLMDDGSPFDPASWEDWLEAVEKSQGSKKK